MLRTILASGGIAGAMFPSLPAAAQNLPEPAIEAQPLEAGLWQQQIANDIPGHLRFRGLPPLRYGLLVTSSGTVRSCMALPVTEEQADSDEARGQDLCESFIEHARFAPARDAAGAPIDSVYIADFGTSRPLVAAHYQGEPIK
ncbi:hypothetical protein [Aurantiacibacter zhengii]|uniref:TonB C-terminal domain-containing protein n=1 Tax=Aurantiacibacter zhengii TaxID=2307003 RepID=A0A418NNC5_9SPHN|nr:hypothetical protein [Aurantiacibacter zhengii]RIV82702.1 hypothetical protein D2V07_17820 [Aurantiacibacter zhengii]